MAGTAKSTSPRPPGCIITTVLPLCIRFVLWRDSSQEGLCRLQISRRIYIVKRAPGWVNSEQIRLSDILHVKGYVRHQFLNLELSHLDHLFQRRQTSFAIERMHWMQPGCEFRHHDICNAFSLCE